MVVGFITPEYPHPSVRHTGGLGTSLGNLLPKLKESGLDVVVFVYGQDNDEVLNQEGLRIYKIRSRKYMVGGWYFNRKYIEAFVTSKIKQHGINLVEVPDWTGISAFSKFPVPTVMRFHGSDTFFCQLENRKQKWKNRWFEKRAVKRADAFVSPTVFAAEKSRELLGVKGEISVVHHGISITQFRNEDPQIYSEDLLLYTGTIIRKKGVLEFPEIMEHVWKRRPSAKLLLIGNDSADAQTGARSTWKLLTDSLPESRKGQIEWLGKIPYEQMQDHIRKAHVCLYPTFAETLGMVTIEAMAMQKPVVSSDFPWVKEIIEEGVSGFMENPLKHEDFALKITQLLSDTQLCKNIGSGARAKVEQDFDIQKTVRQNIAFFQGTIDKYKHREANEFN